MGWPSPPRRGPHGSLFPAAPLTRPDTGRGRAARPRDQGAAARRAASAGLEARPRPFNRARDPETARPLDTQRAHGRTGHPLRADATGRADPHRHQKARPHPTPPRPGQRPPGRHKRSRRLGLPLRLRRRPHPPRPRSPLPRRDHPLGARLPHRLPTLLPATRDPDQRGPNRQRQMLPTAMGNRLPRPADHPTPHPRPPPPNQRKSRTLHPNPAQRMDPTPHLHQQHPAHRNTPPLPQLLQSPQTTPQPQRANTSPTRVNNLPGTHTWFRYAATRLHHLEPGFRAAEPGFASFFGCAVLG